MDSKRFDAVAKSIATGATDRRTVGRLLAGGALGVALGGGALAREAAACCRDPKGCVARRRTGRCVGIGDTCRSTRDCCMGDCEGIDGRMQCARPANLGAPCRCNADCITGICSTKGRICANA